jgi:hypothetical protein
VTCDKEAVPWKFQIDDVLENYHLMAYKLASLVTSWRCTSAKTFNVRPRVTAFLKCSQHHVQQSDSLMDTNTGTRPARGTVAGALEILKATLSECNRASVRFSSNLQALSILPILSLALGRVELHMEFVAYNEESLTRLEDITIGDPAQNCSFLHALGVDLQTISMYLEKANPIGHTVGRDEVEVYARALDQYGEVLKAIWKEKSTEYASTPRLIYLLIVPLENIWKRSCDC